MRQLFAVGTIKLLPSKYLHANKIILQK